MFMSSLVIIAVASFHFSVSVSDHSLMWLVIGSVVQHESFITRSFFSLHGIAMPKGLYFTAVVSFFLSSFFQRLISQVTEQILTKLGHIFTYDCYLKNMVRTPPGIYPNGLGAKKRFVGPTLNFDRTYFCYKTWCQQSERNLSIYRDSPTSPQI